MWKPLVELSIAVVNSEHSSIRDEESCLRAYAEPNSQSELRGAACGGLVDPRRIREVEYRASRKLGSPRGERRRRSEALPRTHRAWPLRRTRARQAVR